MNKQERLRLARMVWMAAIALALTGQLLCYAGPINQNTWYQFASAGAGIAATGCDPADPLGPFCLSSSGTPTEFADAPPWTFTVLETSFFTVTDVFGAGDVFEVFDFGTSLGVTSLPGQGNCFDDPVPCLANPTISHRTFVVGAGNHQISITPAASPFGESTGHFILTATPEPGTWLTLAAGLSALGLRRRRPDLKRLRQRGVAKMAVLVALMLVGGAVLLLDKKAAAQGSARFLGATSSQPIALDADSATLGVVNPDNNSVSFFDVRNDRNRRLATVPVQTEPNGIVLTPDGLKAYVANTVSHTVSVIRLNIANGIINRAHRAIAVGTEPYGLALTPNGTKLYVSNTRSHTISVIDTTSDTVMATISNVGVEPRGLAITNDGDDDDDDETLVVTQFLALPIPGRIDGADNAKKGVLTLISTGTNTPMGNIDLNPIADSGFRAAGDALARIAPGPGFPFVTGVYPNQLNNVAIKGRFAFVPNTGASPNGPFRFNVNTQSLLSLGDLLTGTDPGKTINMHSAVEEQTATPKLFVTVPWAMAFKHTSNQGYVVSAASNHMVKIVTESGTGTTTVQNDPTETNRVLQIGLGRNPRGIVINHLDTRAYVMNYISRDVTVVDLTSAPKETVMATLSSAASPVAGSMDERLHIGKELYNTSIGTFDPATQGGTPIRGRMSNNGWGSCSSCHPFGLTDNVVWIFPGGPRRTLPQHTDFDQSDPTRSLMRALNWSGERDEQEDFELNIRAVSGGQGIIVLPDGVTQDLAVANFTPLASGGRNQLKVRGVGGWDAIKSYVQFGIRSPKSPLPSTETDVVAGRALFTSANCQSCHGGAQWTTARVRFTPPPGAGVIVSGQIIGELRNVGTFDPAFFNEVRNTAAAPLGAAGFVPPSLLSVHAFPQTFLHGGAVDSLDSVMNNVTHRSAGTGGVDTLSNPTDRQRVVRFLQSIDATTVPIAP